MEKRKEEYFKDFHLMMEVVPTSETLCVDDGPHPEHSSRLDNGYSPNNSVLSVSLLNDILFSSTLSPLV